MQRLDELIDRYGVDTVLSVMARLIELSERRLRNRLRATARRRLRVASRFLDNDGASTTSSTDRAELTKDGDSPDLRLLGVLAAGAEYINCTSPDCSAGIAAAVLPTIAYDIPWNAGVFKPLRSSVPRADLQRGAAGGRERRRCSRPAWMVEMASQEAPVQARRLLRRMMPRHRRTPPAAPNDSVFTGTEQQREHFTQLMLDCSATGGGAYADHDGAWTQGQHNIERARSQTPRPTS